MKGQRKTKNAGLVISSKNVRDEETVKVVGLEDVQHSSEQISTAENAISQHKTHQLELSPASIKVRKNTTIKTKSVNYVSRKPITKWSKKSRSNMVARFCTLDYTPLFSPGNLQVFVTLTYPKTWQVVVPDASSAKRHLSMLRKRYEREFGVPLYALWKAEFQRRKAIHFHLLMVINVDLQIFRDWLATTWSDVVNHPDEREAKLHLLAGTGADQAETFLVNQPHLVAVYFSKHSSANEGPKEYQNQPPEEWVTAGKVGRFWGYWNLKPAIVSTSVSYETAVFVSRVLRKWFRSKTQSTKRYVWRTNTKTGVMYKRRVNRKTKRFRGTSGYLAVANGPVMGNKLAEAISKCRPHQFT